MTTSNFEVTALSANTSADALSHMQGSDWLREGIFSSGIVEVLSDQEKMSSGALAGYMWRCLGKVAAVGLYLSRSSCAT